MLVPPALLSAALAIAAASTCAAAGAVPLKDCAECPDLVRVPAGTFEMGSADGEAGRDEGPVRRVTIARSFALGRTEVTRHEFAAFVAATGHASAPGCRTLRDGHWVDDPRADWRDNGLDPPRADLPVTCVSWRDAQAFLDWLSQLSGREYRLPSEAEWEFAAAAGRRSAWPWGNNPDNGCAWANLYDRSGRHTRDFGWAQADCDDGAAGLAPVGRYTSNAYGLHDMIGNVWEWTEDCYSEGYAGAPVDGRAHVTDDCALRSVRGGSWMTRPSRARTSFRGRDPDARRLAYFGFRVARDLSDDEVPDPSPHVGIDALRRVSLVVRDADHVIALLRDVLGLDVSRDAPLAAPRARQALDVETGETLRFAIIEPPGRGGTALGLLEIQPRRDARLEGTAAMAVFAVRGLDALVGQARSIGCAASAPAPFGTPGAPGPHGREATIECSADLRVILQEFGE